MVRILLLGVVYSFLWNIIKKLSLGAVAVLELFLLCIGVG